MKRVGFITERAKLDLIPEDQLIREVLSAQDISVFPIPWDDFDSSSYQKLDMAVIRTPWNYHQQSENFLEWLTKTEKFPVKLHNTAATVRWNINKLYLQELQKKGAPVLPTQFFKFSDFTLNQEWPESPTEMYVLKPTISAAAHRTYKGDKLLLLDILTEENVFRPNETLMLQPFAPSVVTEGELSFLFFNGKFSHALTKKPKSDDFRVQVEHGGSWEYIQPAGMQLEAAQTVMNALGHVPLYARVDMVDFEGRLRLMELEIFEPMLYIKEKSLAQNFADAISARLS